VGVIDTLYIKRTCPNCIKELYPGDCDIVSPVVIDPRTGKHEVLKVAPTSGLKKHLARINPEPITRELVLQSAHRECFHCNYLLPTNIEQVDNINIAVIGDTFSGKSHYIGALIHQIQQGELQRAYSFARFDCITPDIERNYIKDIINPLFQDKQELANTQMAVDTNRAPLIYELILSPSPVYPARRINLILYDASGEDLAIKERMVQFSRYVFSANAIIFLADPTSMPEIYSRLPTFLQKKGFTNRTAAGVLNSILRLIEDYRGYGSGAKLASTPIAITLTKSDLLKQLTSVQKQYSFLKQPVYNGLINLQDLDKVNQEVRQFLEEYGQRTLLQATSNFSKIRFFATSATGYAPDMNGSYPKIDPCRCLDPILWILYELNILHVSRIKP
jgi:GTPase SAR1 family protein